METGLSVKGRLIEEFFTKKVTFEKNIHNELLKEHSLKKHHVEIYNRILNNSILLSPEILFREKIYCYYNGISEVKKCKFCEKRVKFLWFDLGYRTYCSPKCSANDEVVREQYKKTCLEKFGFDNYFKDAEKIKEIYRTKFGVDNISQLDTVKLKKKELSLEKFGTVTPLQNTEVKEKIKKTCLRKYGKEYISQVDEVKEKKVTTSLNHYGVKFPNQSVKVREKTKTTNLQRYGHTNTFHLRKFYKTSKIELKVAEAVQGKKFMFQGREYDIIVGNIVIEIDNPFYHPLSLKNLTITQFTSILNDKKKAEKLKKTEYTLYKVYDKDIEKLEKITIDSLQKIAYKPNYKIGKKTIIMDSEYIQNYINTYGVVKLSRYYIVIVNFFQEFFNLTLTKQQVEGFVASRMNLSYNNISKHIQNDI